MIIKQPKLATMALILSMWPYDTHIDAEGFQGGPTECSIRAGPHTALNTLTKRSRGFARPLIKAVLRRKTKSA